MGAASRQDLTAGWKLVLDFFPGYGLYGFWNEHHWCQKDFLLLLSKNGFFENFTWDCMGFVLSYKFIQKLISSNNEDCFTKYLMRFYHLYISNHIMAAENLSFFFCKKWGLFAGKSEAGTFYRKKSLKCGQIKFTFSISVE